ncbi:hypothetical protein [Paraflavitalea sp. CAU 1676]|uniref:hypothetical protein n=1 Tax=Paraflavitalea sp. CAU 1676 TaxID=3032598 RepID=UPI0023DBC0F7|nr:hypothetical protein [Paraflavitalea sp. CAU 1676]MDF2190495.1 hypothetical protein [Paraflavitalea sp. CAU 1676]
MHRKISSNLLFDPGADSSNSKYTSRNKDFVFDIMDAISSPILTFSMLWADLIPNRLFNQVITARMISLMKSEELASYVECSIYLYTRSHESPMDNDWTDIYTHVCCQTLEQWFGEDHWDIVKAPRRLSEWQESKLKRLRQHIYKKRRELMKLKIRAEEKIEKVPTEVPKTTSQPAKPKVQQASFKF